jgi:hypothetical protein
MTGKMHTSLRLAGSFTKQITVNKRNTNANLDDSVVENRNGDTAPIMSKAQNFNDPPLCSFRGVTEKALAIQKT